MQQNLVKVLVVAVVDLVAVVEVVVLAVVEVVASEGGLLVVEVVDLVDLVVQEVVVGEAMEVVMVVVSRIQDMEVMVVGSQTQVMVVMVVANPSKVVMVVVNPSKVVMVVVNSSKVVMIVVMVVSNRTVVRIQGMILSLKDMVPNHLQLIAITKLMMLRLEHRLLVVMELLPQVMTVVLVGIKGTRTKVRDMANLKRQHHILLEVVRMHSHLRNQLHLNSNMEASLHMELVEVVVDKIRTIMRNHLHSTLKDRDILRLHQVMEILALGTSGSHCAAQRIIIL